MEFRQQQNSQDIGYSQIYLLTGRPSFSAAEISGLTLVHVTSGMHTQTFKLLQLTGQLLIGNYNSIKLGLADHLLCQESPQAGKISGWQDPGSCVGAVEEKTGNSCAFSAEEGERKNCNHLKTHFVGLHPTRALRRKAQQDQKEGGSDQTRHHEVE